MGVHAPYIESSKKYYFEVSENFEKMHVCRNYVDTYLCRFRDKIKPHVTYTKM
jgi:hypothetical protein